MANRPKKAGMKGAKKKGVSLSRIIINTTLGAVVLVFVVAISFLLLQISGKNSLYSRADDGELLTTLSNLAVELGGSIEEEEDWQEGDFRYEGVHYRYNKDILTFLFLGIDKMGVVERVEEGLDGGQSDAIFLLVLNPHNKRISVIGIPRDTMAEVQVYQEDGTYWGPIQAQLAIQHGYGDGMELSCERTVKAVEKLMYGLPINGYCAINMGAIPLLNDAVGGIDVEALETMDFKGFHVEQGEALHLEGMDAYHYLHDRSTAVHYTAGGRLQRQKQYLLAYASAVIDELKKNVGFAASLYGTLSKYMVTDISVNEVSYLAMQALEYSFGDDDMHVLEGETVIGEVYEEFYPDEEALYKLIIETFYEEVE